MYKCVIRTGLAAFLVCAAASRGIASAPEASVIYFTDDGTENGASLYPGFDFHSCWSGLGATADGRVYVTVGNHAQPANSTETHGNAAVFKMNGAGTAMAMLGDLESVSTAQGNWHPDESQHKVHTFLLEHADNRMYFATLDYFPSYYLRGSHMYYINLADDSIVDYSADQPYVLKRDLSVIPNAGTLSDTAGVFCQYNGIKGIALNKNAPDLIYAMLMDYDNQTSSDGWIAQYTLSDGGITLVDTVDRQVPYVMHTDNNGNLFYTKQDNNLYKYDAASGARTRVGALSTGALGSVAPTASGDTVYIQARATGTIYRLVCSTGTLELLATYGGTSAPGTFNMTLDPDGSYLYIYHDTGNKIGRISTATGTVTSTWLRVADYTPLSPYSVQCFGGVNVWDANRNFYAPVWVAGFGYQMDNNLVLLKVHVPAPASGMDPAPVGEHALSYRVGPSPMRGRVALEFGAYHHVAGNTVSITDQAGRPVAQLAGNGNRFCWDGAASGGATAAPGIYYYSTVVDGRAVTGRILKTE